MKSIIQKKKECFICRINYDVTTTNELNKHHIFEEKQSEYNSLVSKSNKSSYRKNALVICI